MKPIFEKLSLASRFAGLMLAAALLTGRNHHSANAGSIMEISTKP